MSGAPVGIVSDGSGGGSVVDSSSSMGGVSEDSVVSVALGGTLDARAVRGGRRGEAGGGAGFSRPHGKTIRKGWATGFFLSSRRASGGTPSGNVIPGVAEEGQEGGGRGDPGGVLPRPTGQAANAGWGSGFLLSCWSKNSGGTPSAMVRMLVLREVS